MQEFHEHMHVFDGKSTREEYFRSHNPVYVLDRIKVPTVYISAFDDPCFPGHFTFQFKDLTNRCTMATVMHLEKGGHATFYEGFDAGTSRAFKVVKEFVQCLQNEGPETSQ
jgi:predicted alpha/beta-fold hydrolase